MAVGSDTGSQESRAFRASDKVVWVSASYRDAPDGLVDRRRGPPPSSGHSSRRSPIGASFAPRTAVSRLNVVAGTEYLLITQMGIYILCRGGSAVDAAIAINACLGFLVPPSRGIGGDAYAMI